MGHERENLELRLVKDNKEVIKTVADFLPTDPEGKHTDQCREP
jgi:hypothetical protein